jgi:hypothetical protein
MLFMLPVAISGCGAKHKPENNAFVCPESGKPYTPKDLIESAIRDTFRYSKLYCKEKYSSVAEFKKRNKRCCNFDPEHINFNERNDFRNLAGIGYLAGQVILRYYCGGPEPDVGKYIYAQANVTSCGVVTESSQGRARPEFPEEFPDQKGGNP